MSGFRGAILVVFGLNFLILNSSFAQKEIELSIKSSPEHQQLIRKYKYSQNHSDSLSAIQTIQSLVNQLHIDGYLLATYDSIVILNDQMTVFLDPGSPFEWLSLSAGNIARDVLRKSGFKESRFEGKRFNLNAIRKIEGSMLSYAERNGYPFASLKYDSLRIDANQLNATLNLDLGPLIRFDSVHVVGSKVLKSRFATAYLGIHMGDPYDQVVVDGIVSKLRRLRYMRLSKSPALSFQNSEAKVTLDLEKRPINTIDGIIGFLPNTSRDNGLLITGQFDLELYNPFATGKKIGLHWRRLSEETQSISIEYDHPNIFRSPLSVETDFEFLKQDTTFTRRDFRIDFSFNLGANSALSFFTDFRNTDLLATSQFANATSLPDIVDFGLTRYGLSLNLDRLDNAFLPRRGLHLKLSASVGNKTIDQNIDLPSEVYQGVDLKTLQYQYDLQFSNYLPLGQRMVLYSELNGGFLSNDQLFQNDAYRLGGLNTIRGFSENFFFATAYAYSTVESRVFFDQSSYLSLFTDIGFIRSDIVDRVGDKNEFALGLGAGINFSTNNGIFNFVYALSTSESSGGLNFNQSKIHFGFTTRF
ncbi:BamA/TamA family outer membrane protein [Roseivirga sp. E12]|uniref:BamA/TamA family outer membrane protein n=1 Tax=Roseivirga sp. E12 TaxID=2819237 RepID=UPI001ABCACA6|nr:BamA/TamA family outer membrane protein [Roseivirga sp. E12]MBO3698883.1 BamA/TamA family outer membrane protein [Roseivirga sp. E12]